MNRTSLMLFLTVACAAACSRGDGGTSPEEPSNSQNGKGDYFNSDDRVSPYDESLPDEARQWARATALLAKVENLGEDAAGSFLESKTLGEARSLCDDEPFAEEPKVGSCSSFLVHEDIMVTAGHCAKRSDFCDRALFVFDFGYYEEGGDPTRVTQDQLYRCAELIDFVYQGNDLDDVDYALVRLDRPVTDRVPLSVRQDGRIQAGGFVTLIGYPDGIPVKVDTGGVVFHSGETRLVSTSDTFAAHSGSVVINSATGLVEAVHVASGGDRYVSDGSCKRAKRCQEAFVDSDQCEGAMAVHATVWAEALNAAITGISNDDVGIGDMGSSGENSQTGPDVGAPDLGSD